MNKQLKIIIVVIVAIAAVAVGYIAYQQFFRSNVPGEVGADFKGPTGPPSVKGPTEPPPGNTSH